jgi:hypothetical protein
MLRTLGVVFALVIPLGFFAQASPGDSKKIRPVSDSVALSAFAQDTHAPVPSTPPGWVVNVATYDTRIVRIGFVRAESYAEFTGGSGAGFLETYAGKGSVDGTVDLGGTPWQKYTTVDGHTSLLRQVAGVTVLIGGIRETATDAELTELAETVR